MTWTLSHLSSIGIHSETPALDDDAESPGAIARTLSKVAPKGAVCILGLQRKLEQALRWKKQNAYYVFQVLTLEYKKSPSMPDEVWAQAFRDAKDHVSTSPAPPVQPSTVGHLSTPGEIRNPLGSRARNTKPVGRQVRGGTRTLDVVPEMCPKQPKGVGFFELEAHDMTATKLPWDVVATALDNVIEEHFGDIHGHPGFRHKFMLGSGKLTAADIAERVCQRVGKLAWVPIPFMYQPECLDYDDGFVRLLLFPDADAEGFAVHLPDEDFNPYLNYLTKLNRRGEKDAVYIWPQDAPVPRPALELEPTEYEGDGDEDEVVVSGDGDDAA